MDIVIANAKGTADGADVGYGVCLCFFFFRGGGGVSSGYDSSTTKQNAIVFVAPF